MHKRIICALLVLIIILGMIPAFALTSRAASNMKTGEKCIQILKDMEGFIKYPMWDHTHYSVGYGSTCGKGDYPNGITEAEADALLRKFLSTMEEELNRFADRNDILFSQNQFDALMLFTYNCGTGWLYSEGDLRTAVLDDATGNDLIFGLSQWCIASGEVLPSLVNRRLIEADMYLNGSYTNKKPQSFVYVTFDNNGGEGRVRVQGYDSNLTAYVKSTPTRNGYKFLGWYSEPVGGSWITELTEQHAGKTLYAHWQGAEPVAASYQRASGLLASLEIYDAPNGAAAGTLSADEQVSICSEYLDASGRKWGKLPNGNWVNLGDPRIGTGDETVKKTGVKATVTGDCVNVRTGPGTGYQAVSAVWMGDVLFITETRTVDGVLWGRFRAGWICLEFAKLEGSVDDLENKLPQEPETTEPETTVPEVTEPETTVPGNGEEATVVQGIPATVISRTALNIRSGPGTNHARVGSYNPGQKISVLEQKNIGTAIWGRTDQGWVSMQYVRLDESWQLEFGVHGLVNCTGALNIRSGPGVTYRPAGAYAAGSRIVILEQTTVSGQRWGRTDKGWVCMDYIRLEASVATPPQTQQPETTEPETSEPENTVPEVTEPEITEPEITEPEPTEPEVTEPAEDPEQVTGTVTADYLNIRSAAGTANKIVGSYRRDTKVTILEQKIVNGTAWGRTDKGWISLAYVKLDIPENQIPAQSGVITANVLNIRKGAGTGNAIVGSYTRGQKVTILETAKVGATTWGRTDKGWICMDYVK